LEFLTLDHAVLSPTIVRSAEYSDWLGCFGIVGEGALSIDKRRCIPVPLLC
jgi:hypothetical protein